MPAYLTPPSADSWFKFADHEGELLFVTPFEERRGTPTPWGEKDVIAANIVVIGPDGSTEEHDGVEISGSRLVKQLRKILAKHAAVLGVLEKGQSRNGFPAPWVLADPTPADQKLAEKAFSANTASDSAPPF